VMRKLCAGSTIFMGNETNDRAGDQLQPGHFKESGSASVKIWIGILEKMGL
jgi:hypothetical protein